MEGKKEGLKDVIRVKKNNNKESSFQHEQIGNTENQ